MKNRIKAVLASLDYDFANFDLNTFTKVVVATRQREIIIMPVDFASALSAIWAKAPHLDYIFYNANHHPIQQVHSIMHEFAHMLLDHDLYDLSDVLPPPLLEQLGTGLQLGRTRYATRLIGDPQQEEEAELFVFLALEERLRQMPFDSWMKGGSSVPTFKSISDAMGFVE